MNRVKRHKLKAAKQTNEAESNLKSKIGADYTVVTRSTLERVRVMTERVKGVAGSRFSHYKYQPDELATMINGENLLT
jgi:hypothetical protein